MIPLTPEQQAEVEKLVAAGWPREAAEVMVAESEPDVILDKPAPRRRKTKISAPRSGA